MSRRTLAGTLALATVLALAAGCGERTEPLGDLPFSFPVTVRGAGDAPTTLERAPERIVALDAGAAELIDALGAGDRLAGAPAGVVLESAGGAEEVVTPAGQIAVAAIAGLQPDLIIATPDTDPVELSRVRERTGAGVYLQPAQSLEDVERAIIELGFLVGEPVRARTLVGTLQRKAAEIEERLKDVEPVTVFVDTGLFITVPARSLLGDLIRRAKGRSVGGNDPGPGPFSLDELARSNPSVYIATSDSRVTLETLEQNSRTRDLDAVRNGRFVLVEREIVTRAGPSVADALRELAVALHPEVFR